MWARPWGTGRVSADRLGREAEQKSGAETVHIGYGECGTGRSGK